MAYHSICTECHLFARLCNDHIFVLRACCLQTKKSEVVSHYIHVTWTSWFLLVSMHKQYQHLFQGSLLELELHTAKLPMFPLRKQLFTLCSHLGSKQYVLLFVILFSRVSCTKFNSFITYFFYKWHLKKKKIELVNEYSARGLCHQCKFLHILDIEPNSIATVLMIYIFPTSLMELYMKTVFTKLSLS